MNEWWAICLQSNYEKTLLCYGWQLWYKWGIFTDCLCLWNLTVRPAPARFPAVKRPMPAAGSMEMKRMRMAPAVMSAHMPTSTTSASLPTSSMSASSSEAKQRNPVSVLNQYNAGLSYHVVGEYGQPHLKTFTMELIVDGQVGVIRCFTKMSFILH